VILDYESGGRGKGVQKMLDATGQMRARTGGK